MYSDNSIQDERDVIDLLSKCGQDYTSRDSYYYKISSRRMRAKEVERFALFNLSQSVHFSLNDVLQVQIIPWVISDSNYVKCAAPRLDPQVLRLGNGFIFTSISSPEDCLCWSSPRDDDRAGACHDLPGLFDSPLVVSVGLFANKRSPLFLNLLPTYLKHIPVLGSVRWCCLRWS